MWKSFFILSVFITVLPAAAEDKRFINARVVYFQDAKDNPADLFYVSDSGEFAKTTPIGGLGVSSAKMVVNASGQVELLKSASAGSTVAVAKVPTGVTDAVFFLLKSAGATSTGATYQVLVADESNKNMPRGGGFICNIAPSGARALMGGVKFELPSGKTAYFKRPEKLDGYNMASFQVESQENGAWKPIKDTMLRFSENERYFFIVYREAGTDPTVKIYKQFMPVERSTQERSSSGS